MIIFFLLVIAINNIIAGGYLRFAAVTLILMQTACQTFWLFLICHFVSKENALLWAYPNAFRLFGSTEIMAAARQRFSIIKYDNAILQGESAGRVIK
ncbi:MAG: hypothetical protein MR881_07175 [Bacteroidales bacterium]|nr:hypothetical protein [Bacteroidales bacterium]